VPGLAALRTPLVALRSPVVVARLMTLPVVEENSAISESTDDDWPVTLPPVAVP
jgi:hypothetical protein